MLAISWLLEGGGVPAIEQTPELWLSRESLLFSCRFLGVTSWLEPGESEWRLLSATLNGVLSPVAAWLGGHGVENWALSSTTTTWG